MTLQMIAQGLLAFYGVGVLLFFVGLIGFQQQFLRTLTNVSRFERNVGFVLGVAFTALFWPVVLGRVLSAHSKRRA